MIPLCRATLDQNEIDRVIEVLESGWYTHGPKNEEFEEKFAEFIGVKHAVSMNSCASALIVSLEAKGIKGEVILPSFTFVASANSVVKTGARPVFADIRYDTCNIDPQSIEALVGPNTEAIMPVHFAGHPCDMDRIMQIADKRGLAVIEDSAETIGGAIKGRVAGSFGTGCFSFFPTKNITTGEGGIVTTNDEELYARIKGLIGHGIMATTSERQRGKKPWLREAVLPGYNFRMSNILAALGVEQMKKLKDMNRKRIEKSSLLIELLNDVDEIDLPVTEKDCTHVFQMFTVKLPGRVNRDEFVTDLRDRGVGASVHFAPPVHQHEYYRENHKTSTDLSVTEDVSRRIVTLPMFPDISVNDIETIASTVKELIVGK